jgi:hypothetical protein
MATIMISITILILAIPFYTSVASANLDALSPQIQTIKSPESGNPMVFPLLLIAALIILAAGIAIIYFSRRKGEHL